MQASKILCCGLTITGLVLLQGCGGGGGSSNNAPQPTASSASSAGSLSSSSSSSTAPSVNVAVAYLGTSNLPPDSGIAGVNALATEDLSPENSQAPLNTDDIPAL